MADGRHLESSYIAIFRETQSEPILKMLPVIEAAVFTCCKERYRESTAIESVCR